MFGLSCRRFAISAVFTAGAASVSRRSMDRTAGADHSSEPQIWDGHGAAPRAVQGRSHSRPSGFRPGRLSAPFAAARVRRNPFPLPIVGRVAGGAWLAACLVLLAALALPANAQTFEETRRSGDCRDLNSWGPSCGIGSYIDRRASGYSEEGAIQSARDGDLWSVIFERGQAYVVEVKGAGDPGGDNGGTLPDPNVEIYELSYNYNTDRWSGTLRASNDNASGTNRNSSLLYTYPSGTERQTPIGIRVSSANGGTGSYTVSVTHLRPETLALTETTDCAGDETTACSIEVGGFVRGNVSTLSDVDAWAIPLKEGRTYQIDVRGVDSGGGTLPDPIVQLSVVAGGTLITSASDNDDGTGKDARVEFLIFTGLGTTYYVRVFTVATTSGGTYTLTVTDITPMMQEEDSTPAAQVTETTDCPAATPTCTFDIGDTVDGALDSSTDIDSWQVDLEEGKTYQFDVEGWDGGDGALSDPTILLYDTGNSEVGSSSTQFTHAVQTGEGGTYVLDVESDGGNTGGYRITATDITPSGQQSARGEAPQPATPLTAAFGKVPAEHDGSSAFDLELHFSAAPKGLSYRTLRGNSFFNVTNGTVTKAKRLKKKDNSGWRVTVEPDSDAAVSIGLLPALPTADCAEAAVVCTADGTRLSVGSATFVPGPASLSVDDATVQEGPNATLDFVVTLSRARHEATTVDYATSDGTATAGADYTADSGTLSFAIGETEKTVSVTVLDDSHDEGSETMRFTLSNPVPSATAKLGDATATGTITNSDAMPQAWIARFGRTVAEQVLDAVESRMQAARTPGVEVSLAGQRIGGGPAAEADEAREAETGLKALAEWVRGEGDEETATGLRSRAVTGRDFLIGSSFALTGGSRESGFASLWGRGAISSFDGREGELTLDGEVQSAMVGADWVLDVATAGVMVSRSRGEGGYRSPGGGGDVESTLTGLYPYGHYAVSDRLSVWGVAGYGEGSLTLTPEGQAPMKTDIDLTLAGAGLRSVMVAAPAEGGLEIAANSDGFVVRTSSDRVQGLAAANAEVTRLRLGLEGTWRGGPLVPSVEIGVRHDGGDAETGFGADIGAGLAWSDPASGISAQLRGRGLLTHADGDFRESGFAGSLSWDPTPSSARGPTLTLSQTLGAQASGGMDSLLSRPTMAGLAANDDGGTLDRRRLEAKLGYGFPLLGDRLIGTPEIGLGLSDTGREYSLGWRLALARSHRVAFDLALEGTRREAANDDAPEHGLWLRGALRW